MHTQEFDAVEVEDSGALFLPCERELAALDDEQGDDHFFTTLESLVEQGSGPLVVVR